MNEVKIDNLITQFKDIDSTEKWYLWVNEVNATSDEQVEILFEKIGKQSIGIKRDKFAIK